MTAPIVNKAETEKRKESVSDEEFIFPIDTETPFNFNHGMAWQVMCMDPKKYSKWVHTPVATEGHSPPFFGHKLLDKYLSKTHWWAIPLLWWPVMLYFIYLGSQDNSSILQLSLAYLGGLVGLWPAIEYFLHRFLFHMDAYMPYNRFFCFAHFMFHGIHHLVPMDKFRLVFPPGMGIPLAYVVINGLRTVFSFLPLDQYRLMIAGTIFGYTFYDLIHYYEHHGSPARDSYFGKMKTYHMKHHYANWEVGFGVSSPLWDYIFGTVLDVKQKNIFKEE